MIEKTDLFKIVLVSVIVFFIVVYFAIFNRMSSLIDKNINNIVNIESDLELEDTEKTIKVENSNGIMYNSMFKCILLGSGIYGVIVYCVLVFLNKNNNKVESQIIMSPQEMGLTNNINNVKLNNNPYYDKPPW